MGNSRKEHKHKREKKKKERKRLRSESPESDSRSKIERKRSRHGRDDRRDERRTSGKDERPRRDDHSRSERHSRDVRHRSRDRQPEVKETVLKQAPAPKKCAPVSDYAEEQVQEDEEEVIGDGTSQASLSIEETNKLRLKLGLKPLDVGNKEDEKNEEDRDFVHKPAEDLWEKKKQEKLREKLKVAKEKRVLQAKMSKVRTLGDDDSDDDIVNWVTKTRKIDEVKKAADEFGVQDIVKDELIEKKQEARYSRNDLKGLEVEHDLENFRDGATEILVIKDKEILDEEEEDILHSVSLQDVEKSKKNLEIKRRGFGYKAYEDEELDEFGFFKPKTVLDKYDEEIEGEVKGKFKIGDDGKVDTTWEQQKEEMKKEIRAKGETLKLPALKLASDYLTEEDLAFKKRKKKVRKIRKREVLKPDDLVPLPGDVKDERSDHGSRTEKKEETKAGDDVIDDVDDAADELEQALEKMRKIKQSLQREKKMDIAAVVKEERLAEEQKKKEGKPVVYLNTTDEFCRKLGDPHHKDSESFSKSVSSGNQLSANAIESRPLNADVTIKHEDMELDDDDDVAMETGDVSDANDPPKTSQWRYGVELNGESEIKQEKDDHVVIEAEPIAGKGIAGALKLAEKKGYILKDVAPKGNSVITTSVSFLKAKNYSIEDKNAVDYLDKYAHEKYSKERSSRHERSGNAAEFIEKRDYKPKIELIYVDERGRNQSPKEAFRKLSHRFHGKGSGKMKQEKRMKKFAEEDAMKYMNSTDTPLNTVAMMKQKQKSQSTPYIVLSGGGKTFISGNSTNTDISKK